MAKRRLSSEEREEYFTRIDAHNEVLEKRRRQLNRAFYRTPLFIATLVVRILFFIFFTWVFITYGGHGYISKEVVLHSERGIYLSGGGIKVEKLIFETPRGTYESHFERGAIPYLAKDHTVNIEHNLFGKPRSFFRDGEDESINFSLNWILYFSIGLLTVMSFKFNTARDNFDLKFLWVTWIANLFAFGHYFLS